MRLASRELVDSNSKHLSCSAATHVERVENGEGEGRGGEAIEARERATIACVQDVLAKAPRKECHSVQCILLEQP